MMVLPCAFSSFQEHFDKYECANDKACNTYAQFKGGIASSCHDMATFFLFGRRILIWKNPVDVTFATSAGISFRYNVDTRRDTYVRWLPGKAPYTHNY